jgi:hypothetical protein
MMKPRLRKIALTAHVASSVGWAGAAAAYLALVLAAATRGDDALARAAHLAIEPIAWFALVPLALATLLTGLLSSLGTPWGLFRHYWVVAKLLITVVATAILLGNMRAVLALSALAGEPGPVDPLGLWSQVVHAGAGLLALLMATALGVIKPWGTTRYGRRRGAARDAE